MRETTADLERLQRLLDASVERASGFEGAELAVIAHGRVTIIWGEEPAFAELDETHRQLGGQSPREWGGHGVYLRLEPTLLYTYARPAPA